MAPSSFARAIGAAFVVLAVPALVGSGVARAAENAAAPQPATVKMIRFTFDPPTVTIPAGSTVTWTYDESASDPQPGCESPAFRLVDAVACPGHSTTAAGLGPGGTPLWDSGVHRADGFPYSRTFTEPGTYPYYCTVHGGPNPNNPLTQMNGTIIVTAAATDAAGASGILPETGGRDWSLPAMGALITWFAARRLRSSPR